MFLLSLRSWLSKRFLNSSLKSFRERFSSQSLFFPCFFVWVAAFSLIALAWRHFSSSFCFLCFTLCLGETLASLLVGIAEILGSSSSSLSLFFGLKGASAIEDRLLREYFFV